MVLPLPKFMDAGRVDEPRPTDVLYELSWLAVVICIRAARKARRETMSNMSPLTLPIARVLYLIEDIKVLRKLVTGTGGCRPRWIARIVDRELEWKESELLWAAQVGNYYTISFLTD